MFKGPLCIAPPIKNAIDELLEAELAKGELLNDDVIVELVFRLDELVFEEELLTAAELAGVGVVFFDEPPPPPHAVKVATNPRIKKRLNPR